MRFLSQIISLVANWQNTGGFAVFLRYTVVVNAARKFGFWPSKYIYLLR
jgi:hypothetical protein